MAPSLYSRYRNLETVTADAKISLARRPPPSPAIPPDSIVHTVIGRETLDLLAWKYYGREDLWWRIADANPDITPFLLSPGQTLAIPPLRIATRTGA
jgi:nucleoid-associated protein YgaU